MRWSTNIFDIQVNFQMSKLSKQKISTLSEQAFYVKRNLNNQQTYKKILNLIIGEMQKF